MFGGGGEDPGFSFVMFYHVNPETVEAAKKAKGIVNASSSGGGGSLDNEGDSSPRSGEEGMGSGGEDGGGAGGEDVGGERKEIGGGGEDSSMGGRGGDGDGEGLRKRFTSGGETNRDTSCSSTSSTSSSSSSSSSPSVSGRSPASLARGDSEASTGGDGDVPAKSGDILPQVRLWLKYLEVSGADGLKDTVRKAEPCLTLFIQFSMREQ